MSHFQTSYQNEHGTWENYHEVRPAWRMTSTSDKAVRAACKRHDVLCGWIPWLVSERGEAVLPQASAACVEKQHLHLLFYSGIIYRSNWMKKKMLCSLELNHPWRDELITNTLYSTNYSVAWRIETYKAGLRNALWVGEIPEHTCM